MYNKYAFVCLQINSFLVSNLWWFLLFFFQEDGGWRDSHLSKETCVALHTKMALPSSWSRVPPICGGNLAVLGPRDTLTRKGQQLEELSRAVWDRRRFLCGKRSREKGQHPQDSIFSPELSPSPKDKCQGLLDRYLGWESWVCCGLTNSRKAHNFATDNLPRRVFADCFFDKPGTDGKEKRKGAGPGRGTRLCFISLFFLCAVR